MALYDDLYRIARRSLLSQISITDRLIRQLYIRAAKSIARQIETAKAGSLTERWLTAYKSALDAEIERLGNGIYSTIERGAQRAAEARVECTAEYLRRACAAAGVDDSFTPTLANVPTDTLRAMMEGKLYTDGRMLSTRIWNEMGRLEGNIAEIIQQGVAQQMDAITLARQLEAYVNPDAAQPVSWHALYPDIPFDREIDYNALRLARTSLNHAHWAAGKAAAKKNPLCKGMKWNLSNRHHERQVEPNGEDVCDVYARHDEGLGVGVYPIDKLPMPHPQCLCYQTEAVPTLEDAADLLRARLETLWVSKSAPVGQTATVQIEDLKRRAWARGEAESPEMDEGFRKWQRENAEELNNWYGGVDNSGENGTMEMYRRNAGGYEPSVMPPEQFNRIKRCFARRGGLIQTDEEAVRYLNARMTEGITLNENTIVLYPNPSNASVFEELIHSAQIKRGERDETPRSRIQCEIIAQKKLLKYRRAYHLSDGDVYLTEKNLAGYLNDWFELTGKEWEDESD